MFQSAFQDGDSLEVFSPAGKDPAIKWNLSGKVGRLYDKGVKGYVLAVGGGATSKMQIPKSSKGTRLRQRHLVMQVLTAASHDKPFSFELGVTDIGGTMRRLVLSSSFRALHCTPLHAQIPLPGLEEHRGSWANLSVDLAGLTSMCLEGNAFRALDLLSVGPTCRIRKIFTMRGALDQHGGRKEEASVTGIRDVGDMDNAPVGMLPPRMVFPGGIRPTPMNWVISPATLRAFAQRLDCPSAGSCRTTPPSRRIHEYARSRPITRAPAALVRSRVSPTTTFGRRRAGTETPLPHDTRQSNTSVVKKVASATPRRASKYTALTTRLRPRSGASSASPGEGYAISPPSPRATLSPRLASVKCSPTTNSQPHVLSPSHSASSFAGRPMSGCLGVFVSSKTRSELGIRSRIAPGESAATTAGRGVNCGEAAPPTATSPSKILRSRRAVASPDRSVCAPCVASEMYDICVPRMTGGGATESLVDERIGLPARQGVAGVGAATSVKPATGAAVDAPLCEEYIAHDGSNAIFTRRRTASPEAPATYAGRATRGTNVKQPLLARDGFGDSGLKALSSGKSSQANLDSAGYQSDRQERKDGAEALKGCSLGFEDTWEANIEHASAWSFGHHESRHQAADFTKNDSSYDLDNILGSSSSPLADSYGLHHVLGSSSSPLANTASTSSSSKTGVHAFARSAGGGSTRFSRSTTKNTGPGAHSSSSTVRCTGCSPPLAATVTAGSDAFSGCFPTPHPPPREEDREQCELPPSQEQVGTAVAQRLSEPTIFEAAPVELGVERRRDGGGIERSASACVIRHGLHPTASSPRESRDSELLLHQQVVVSASNDRYVPRPLVTSSAGGVISVNRRRQGEAICSCLITGKTTDGRASETEADVTRKSEEDRPWFGISSPAARDDSKTADVDGASGCEGDHDSAHALESLVLSKVSASSGRFLLAAAAEGAGDRRHHEHATPTPQDARNGRHVDQNDGSHETCVNDGRRKNMNGGVGRAAFTKSWPSALSSLSQEGCVAEVVKGRDEYRSDKNGASSASSARGPRNAAGPPREEIYRTGMPRLAVDGTPLDVISSRDLSGNIRHDDISFTSPITPRHERCGANESEGEELMLSLNPSESYGLREGKPMLRRRGGNAERNRGQRKGAGWHVNKLAELERKQLALVELEDSYDLEFGSVELSQSPMVDGALYLSFAEDPISRTEHVDSGDISHRDSATSPSAFPEVGGVQRLPSSTKRRPPNEAGSPVGHIHDEDADSILFKSTGN